MASAQDTFKIGSDERALVSKGMGVQEEIGGKASQTYPVGSYFVGNDGYMYQADANIAKDATLVASGTGKNCTQTTIAAINQTLTNEVHGNWSEGGINLLPPILYNNAPSMTYVGVTLTIDDLKFKLTGTASGDGGRLNLRTDPFTLKAGIYTVSGVIGTSTAVHKASDNTVIIMRVNPSEYATFTLESDTEVFVGINVSNGITYNETVGLQIEKGSTATSYQPYAMTNRELTKLAIVGDLSSQVTLTENCFSCSLLRQGNICHVNVAVKSGVNGFTSVATIPTDLKPKYNTPMACFAVAGADSPKIEDAVLNTNGLISIRTTSAISDIAYLTCTWIA